MMPPTDLTPRQLFAELTTMPRPHRLVDFPRRKIGADGRLTNEFIFKLPIWPLTQDEQLRAGIAAEKLVRQELPDAKDGESIGYNKAYENAVAAQQLVWACRDPSDLAKPFFPNANELRTHMTADEVGALYWSYLEVCAELGPVISRMSVAETDAWIDRLIIGGSEDDLSFFSLGALKTLLLSSVARLRISSTQQSSVGGPPSDTVETSDSPSESKSDFDRIGGGDNE